MPDQFEQAFNEASSSLTATEEAVPQEAPKSETVEPEKTEASQEKPETFLEERPDDSELTPTEREKLARWEKAYQNKRKAESQELRAMREEAETLRQQLQQYQQLQQQVPTQAQYPQQPVDQRQALLEFRQSIVQDALKTVQETQEAAYLGQAAKQFETVDARLSEDHPDHDRWLRKAVLDELAQARASYEEQNGTVIGFDFVGMTKQLVEQYDADMAERYQKRLSQDRQKARATAEKVGRQNPRSTSSSGTVKKTLSLDEALEEVLQEAN